MSSQALLAIVPTTGRRQTRGVARDYLSLTKPRIVILLLVTELTSMVVVSRSWPSGRQVLAAVVGGFCAAGGASALNCWWDRDLDRMMRRTASRPLPAGRLKPAEALTFGLGLNLAAVLTLWGLASPAAAALAMAGSAYYVVLYTMALKRHTSQNIVIGGGAGAFPVLVGSVIATGQVGWMAAALFAIVFFWTPPHFWSLALLLRGDYARAGVPMLPSVASAAETRRAILGYLGILIAVSLLPAAGLGLWYGIPVAGLDAYYLALAIQALRVHGDRPSARLFRFSLVYLAAVFACCATVAVVARPG